jgi:hypothetical protein
MFMNKKNYIYKGMLHLRELPGVVSSTSAISTSAAINKGGDGSVFVFGEGSSSTSGEGVSVDGPTNATSGFATLVLEDKLRRRTRVLTRRELIMLLTELPPKLHLVPQDRHQGRICVGMLGYPNVGKSSAINTILAVSKSSHGVTRVAVSATPGKTKHFQTLMVSDSLMLCDCPGTYICIYVYLYIYM